MYTKLRNLLRFATISNKEDSSKQFPVQQAQYDQKVSDVFIMHPYGLHANLPNNALITLLSMQGDDANRVGIGGYTGTRPSLEQGEVAFFHPVTGAIIKLLNDGSIDIDGVGNDITINGATITADGDFVTASGISLDTHVHPGTGTLSNSGGPVGGNTDEPIQLP